MKKLPAVEEAKTLMTEAEHWSVMKWLREKKRVRHAADKANNTLWAIQKAVKYSWPDDLKLAYGELGSTIDAPGAGGGAQLRALDNLHKSSTTTPEVELLAKRVKQADYKAYQAHLDAEKTFDMADKRLSTSLAREGCRKAIHSWELYEQAITKAESASDISSASVKQTKR